VLWCGMLEAHAVDSEDLDRIIVGLGNPGEQYARSRHNVGFMTMDALAREASGGWSESFLSRICRAQIDGHPVLLAEPLTYMNRSGEAVHVLLSALHRNPGDLLLVFDDLNLPLGRIRIRERGSAGGHHGLESILTVLKTEEILRVRLGIGEEQMPRDKKDFVLSDFPSGKQADLSAMIANAGNAVKSILRDGVSKSMTMFNA
jgi:peptidyl-tRNA hydrolase, PTH1 family